VKGLKRRELQVKAMLDEGKGYQEIADELMMSVVYIRRIARSVYPHLAPQSRKQVGEERRIEIEKLAAAGHTRKEAAAMLGIRDHTVSFYAQRYGIEFVRPAGKVCNLDRVTEIVMMRKRGRTLADIGMGLGITKERVRQILEDVGDFSEYDQRGNSRLPGELIERAVKMRVAGVPVGKIASKLGCSPETILKYTKSVTEAQREATKRRNEAICSEYTAGATMRELALKYGMVLGSINRIVVANGAHKRKRYPRKPAKSARRVEVEARGVAVA
jgi:DNA-binding CsgD family transcriptional regulator